MGYSLFLGQVPSEEVPQKEGEIEDQWELVQPAKRRHRVSFPEGKVRGVLAGGKRGGMQRKWLSTPSTRGTRAVAKGVTPSGSPPSGEGGVSPPFSKNLRLAPPLVRGVSAAFRLAKGCMP